MHCLQKDGIAQQQLQDQMFKVCCVFRLKAFYGRIVMAQCVVAVFQDKDAAYQKKDEQQKQQGDPVGMVHSSIGSPRVCDFLCAAESQRAKEELERLRTEKGDTEKRIKLLEVGTQHQCVPCFCRADHLMALIGCIDW